MDAVAVSLALLREVESERDLTQLTRRYIDRGRAASRSSRREATAAAN